MTMPQHEPRGVLPDAMDETTLYLFKRCSYLRLTYEIRLMAFMAQQDGLAFVLVVGPNCEVAPALRNFIGDGYVQVRQS